MPNEAASTRSLGVTVLATLAVVAALYLGREFLIPVALSILFAALLRPVVRWMEHARIPAPVGATIVLVAITGAGTVAGLAAAGPIREWLAEAPRSLGAARHRLQELRRPFDRLTAAARQAAGVEASGAGGAGRSRDTSSESGTAIEGPGAPGLAVRIFGTTTSLVGAAVEVLLLTFLLLASGDRFMTKLVKVLRVRREKLEAVRVVQEAEGVVSRYMLVTALINVGQGVVVGLAMWLLDLPNPALWGVLTMVLEFIPYLGGALMLILLAMAGLAQGGGLGPVLLPPAVYLTITTLQNNLVSPVAYGQRLRLNPVAVLVGVLFWWFLWGIPGAFLAVPIIATVKILGDHLPQLEAVGEFLSE
jgi:predicted PurR-regulated permease PerM